MIYLHASLRRQSFIILAVFLLFSPIIIHSGADEEFKRLTILVSEDSILASAQRLQVNPRSMEAEYNSILLSRAEQTLEIIRRAGINYKLVDILTYSVHAVIIDVPVNQIQYLKSVIGPERIQEDEVLYINLENELVIGALTKEMQSLNLNSTGRGVLVAVIDTGVDYTHPDLGGAYGPGNKVVGGYDFVENDEDPKDIDGHGTHVAGIIAANGRFKGVAPEAQILAYRVVGDRGGVRTSAVTRAIDRAIRDGAKVINLSLGSSTDIDVLRRAVSSATKAEVIIVAAAGNLGPSEGRIGSPAGQYSTIAVGSSVIPLRSELMVAGSGLIESRAMLGSTVLPTPISGDLVFVKYARPTDVQSLDLAGKIAIAERGGENDERVFFSIKEESVSAKGAVGLVVYNNQPGIFEGALVHDQTPAGYYPQIPVVSVSRETGLSLLEKMKNSKVSASIKIETMPEQLERSSSRGPVSAFYAKPDLIAPGMAVTSTAPDGRYSILSGTSFAAPSVTGLVTLLLEKNNLTKDDIVGIIAPASRPLRNTTTGELFPMNHQGSGRIDIANAVTAPVSIMPHQIIAHLAPSQVIFNRAISIKSITNTLANVSVSTSWNSSKIQVSIAPRTFTVEPNKIATINFTAELIDPDIVYGSVEGRITLTVSGTSGRTNTLTLPVAVTTNPVSLIISKNVDGYYITATSYESFREFRAVVRNLEGEVHLDRTVTAGTFVDFAPRTKGEYSIEVEITDGDRRMFGRAIINADVIISKPQLYGSSGIPMRFLQILFGSITLLAIGSSFYLLGNSRKRKVD